MPTTRAFPRYFHQPSGGIAPMDYGPPDIWPSARNPEYNMYADSYGRFLAGLGGDTMQVNNTNADGVKEYANELDLLANADDVVGNGVFDPNGSPPTNHADQTIFADHVSMPGYIMRDKFYEPSEVIDITTGLPVMYVPGGAVALDQGQRETYFENLMWQNPGGVDAYPIHDTGKDSIWIPEEASWPVSGIGQTEKEPASNLQLFFVAGISGLAVGLLLATIWPRKA